MLENVPQLMLQYQFMFKLNIFTNIVIASFISSIFNILMALMSAAVFWILHRNQADIPFTITLSWNKRSNSPISVSKKDLDPFSQCGRRKKLAKSLGEIAVVDDKPLEFEILSTKKQTSGCTLFGVFVADQSTNAMSRSDTFSDFMDREQEIKNAVMTAFGLKSDFGRYFAFRVSIARSTHTSRAERAKLAVDTLRDFKVPKGMVSAVRKHINAILDETEQKEEVDDEGDVGTIGGTTV